MNPNRILGVGTILACLYLMIYCALLVFFFVLNPTKSEFAGVYFIFLTLPLSMILVGVTILLDFLGHPDAIPSSVVVVLLTIAALINSRYLYKLGMEKKNSDKRAE